LIASVAKSQMAVPAFWAFQNLPASVFCITAKIQTACRRRTNTSHQLIQMEVFGPSILVIDGSRPCLRKVLLRSVLARCVVHAILTTLIVVAVI
jgi:hypothetical protein